MIPDWCFSYGTIHFQTIYIYFPFPGRKRVFARDQIQPLYCKKPIYLWIHDVNMIRLVSNNFLK